MGSFQNVALGRRAHSEQGIDSSKFNNADTSELQSCFCRFQFLLNDLKTDRMNRRQFMQTSAASAFLFGTDNRRIFAASNAGSPEKSVLGSFLSPKFGVYWRGSGEARLRDFVYRGA
jgi:hypothetical protein